MSHEHELAKLFFFATLAAMISAAFAVASIRYLMRAHQASVYYITNTAVANAILSTDYTRANPIPRLQAEGEGK